MEAERSHSPTSQPSGAGPREARAASPLRFLAPLASLAIHGAVLVAATVAIRATQPPAAPASQIVTFDLVPEAEVATRAVEAGRAAGARGSDGDSPAPATSPPQPASRPPIARTARRARKVREVRTFGPAAPRAVSERETIPGHHPLAGGAAAEPAEAESRSLSGGEGQAEGAGDGGVDFAGYPAGGVQLEECTVSANQPSGVVRTVCCLMPPLMGPPAGVMVQGARPLGPITPGGVRAWQDYVGTVRMKVGVSRAGRPTFVYFPAALDNSDLQAAIETAVMRSQFAPCLSASGTQADCTIGLQIAFKQAS